MTKKILLPSILIIGAIFLVGYFSYYSQKSSEKSASNNSATININDASNLMSVPKKAPAEKIEVVHFHATQQCWSCITVGEYALKTIKEKFPEEYQNGTIVFKDVNGELQENRDMVAKYQARGSSLFINAITSGKDKIEEDVTVWRLITNESQFINYFENKLKTLLGK